jgi:L-alanine-DL-glutamate epimerase-like enolase superfamily enzyme
VVAKDGKVAVPDKPGLGCDPDMDVLRRYMIAGPTLHDA